MEARRFRRESVLITNNEGEREESGRDSRLPSRRIRAKSVHACSREFYSFPSFLSFFFFIFSNFQFLFSLVCTCVCVCVVCVFPFFSCFFPPFFFFSFSFQSTEERGIARNEIANCATSQKRVRRSLDKLHNLPNGFVLLRLFFSFFILLISVVSRVYACVCSPRVCRRATSNAASLEKLEIIKADERTSTSFSTPPDDSGTLCARVPI